MTWSPRDRLPDRVQAYNNPALIAGRGDEQGLRGLIAVLGADVKGPVSLDLVDPQVRVLALFTNRQSPAAIAQDIRLILEATPGGLARTF